MEKFYITTTLPYVNASPHIGFALEIVQADIIARYWRLMGKEVIFNTGTDEHGLKVYKQAIGQNKEPKAYVDEYAAHFERLKKSLNVSYTHFIRTSDPAHMAAAQEFWKRCFKNGFINKRFYTAKYCFGCELEKTDSELADGRCPLHPNLELERIEEENYFFTFSAFQKKLLKLYADHPDFVLPTSRLHEITRFVEAGLQDFSISRLKEKMPWGVPVPDDSKHVMYVWFDALVNYISTLGWPHDEKSFSQFWPGMQVAGKDNLRQQSAIWQAMLMAADLPPSKQIVIHGFIGSGGAKMSKSLGNVVDPYEIVERYGTDALRYWIAREANTFEDSDFTWEKFHESYTANLVNGLGNLVSRVVKMADLYDVHVSFEENAQPWIEYRAQFEKFEIQTVANSLWDRIRGLDYFIQQTQPFKLIKTDERKAKEAVQYLMRELRSLALCLQPFMPETSEKILQAFENPKNFSVVLFPRIS